MEGHLQHFKKLKKKWLGEQCLWKPPYLLSLVLMEVLYETIVIRNGKIVWKHGPNRPFYGFMLRTKLYQNPLFSALHQNVRKPKSRAVRTVYGPIFSPFYVIIISVFFFFLPKCKYNRVKLCYNRLKFAKETQIGTVSNIEWRARLHRS